MSAPRSSPGTRRPLHLLSLETILEEPLPAVEWLVEPLIGNGNRVVVYGEFASYKSWALLHLALHIATGTAWLGAFAIASPRRVLYIDEEMTERLLRRRVRRLATGMDLSRSAGMFRCLSRRGLRAEPRNIGDLQTDLIGAGFDPEVVIVETFRRLLVGNENDARDVAEFWRSVGPLVQNGRTFIVSHHMKKPPALGTNATRHRASGSTDILGGTDDALAFERKGDDAFIVEHIKSRDGQEREAFAVSVEMADPDGPVILHFAGTPDELKGRPSKTAQARQRVLEYLNSAPDQTARTDELLRALEGICSASTVERVLRELYREERLEHPDGRPGVYRLRHPSSPKERDGDGSHAPSPSPINHPSITDPSANWLVEEIELPEHL